MAQSYEEWKASHGDVEPRKEIESGTEAPKNLMPGSPLAKSANDNSVESTISAVVEVQESKPVSYALPIISAGCSFLIGILVATLFFRTKIKHIRKECETKISEARATLDRVIQMVTQNDTAK